MRSTSRSGSLGRGDAQLTSSSARFAISCRRSRTSRSGTCIQPAAPVLRRQRLTGLVGRLGLAADLAAHRSLHIAVGQGRQQPTPWPSTARLTCKPTAAVHGQTPLMQQPQQRVMPQEQAVGGQPHRHQRPAGQQANQQGRTCSPAGQDDHGQQQGAGQRRRQLIGVHGLVDQPAVHQQQGRDPEHGRVGHRQQRPTIRQPHQPCRRPTWTTARAIPKVNRSALAQKLRTMTECQSPFQPGAVPSAAIRNRATARPDRQATSSNPAGASPSQQPPCRGSRRAGRHHRKQPQQREGQVEDDLQRPGRGDATQ